AEHRARAGRPSALLVLDAGRRRARRGAGRAARPSASLRDRLPAVAPGHLADLEQALDTLPVEDPLFVLALHGGAGEDGTVQRMMEQRGIAFTGSGSAASAAAFDKGRAKEMVRNRLKVAESRVIADPRGLAAAAREM